jgi:hypothetical protein
MKLRQSLKTRADIMQLVHFVQNRFKSHGYAPFMGLRGRELQMDCLASEDLKRGEGVATPFVTCTMPQGHLLIQIDL